MHKYFKLRWLLILSFITPMSLYLLTMLPDVGFWDTGEFQTIIHTLDIAHPTGYPTYILLGKIFISIFNFGTIAWRANLLSSIYVSLGLFTLSILIKKISNNLLLSILIPLFLSVNPYLWSIAIRADPHSLHFLFVSLFLYLSYLTVNNKKVIYLALLYFVTGLSLGNHMLSIFLIPALFIQTIYLKTEIINKKEHLTFIFGLILFVLGISTYSLLPIISSLKPPLTINYDLTNIVSFKRHVFGSDFQGVMHSWINGSFKEALIYLGKLYSNSFPLYSWTLVIAGFFVASIKYFKYNLVLISIYIITLYFSLRYQNAALERYFVGPFLISYTWFSIYVSEVFKKHNKIIIKYSTFVFLFLCILLNINRNYIKIDESKNNYPREWSKSSLDEIEKNGVVFSWWSYSTPLWYMKLVENYRDDVTIINMGTGDWESEAIRINNENTYFIQDIELHTKGYELKQHGNLYKLIKS